jgi:hypothetical protein
MAQKIHLWDGKGALLKFIISLAVWRWRKSSSTSRWCCSMEGLAMMISSR